jgi:tetraacyldisaccharide 4'-kinase
MRKLLMPLSFIYGIITTIRNILFDVGILKSKSFEFPIIGVGNLSMGGTGKSPHVLYIANLFKDNSKLAILSRGYGRKSKGYKNVEINDSAREVGDEPLQYKQQLNEVKVAVCEKRVEGVELILKESIGTNLILLDDAFQHRYLKPTLNLLITDINSLFYDDFVIPAGNLRERKIGVKRAHAVIVSKTPLNFEVKQRNQITERIKRYGIENIFFSYMHYREELTFVAGGSVNLDQIKEYAVFLVAGIAKPQPLIDFVSGNSKRLEFELFKDHHAFTVGDIIHLKKKFDKFAAKQAGKKIILTTRKDAVRLMIPELLVLIKDLPIAIIDIEVKFHSYGSITFDRYIQNYVKTYSGIS